jgi:hypothetical protein
MENKNSYLPDILADDSVKSTPEYALKVFQYIRDYSRSEYFTKRNARYERARKYLDGRQDIKDYREELNIGIDGTSKGGKYELAGTSIIRTYIRKIEGKLLSDDLTVNIESSDIYSKKKKSKRIAEYIFNKELAPQLEALKAQGIDLEIPTEKKFKTQEELELWVNSDNKLMEEIILETEITDNFDDNKFLQEKRRKIIHDAITYNLIVNKTYLDSNGFIKHKNILPDNFIHPLSYENDLSDIMWCAERVEINISDARILFKNEITEEELYNMALLSKSATSIGFSQNYDRKWENSMIRPYDDFKITLIEGYIKLLKDESLVVALGKYDNKYALPSSKKNALSKKGKDRVIEEIDRQRYDVWCGFWCEGLDKVIKWGKMKGQLKKNSELQDVSLPYSCYMYENTLGSGVSMVESVIGLVRQLDILEAKLYNSLANIKPDPIAIDVDALSDVYLYGFNDIVDSNGNPIATSPKTLLDIYDATGKLFHSTKSNITGDNDFDVNGRQKMPITPLGAGMSDTPQRIRAMIDVIKQYIKETLGYNDYTDGTSSNDRSNQLMIQTQVSVTNNSMKFLEDAVLSVIKQTAEKTGIIIWDSISLEKDGVYAKKIGEVNAEALRESNDAMDIFDFNVYIEKGLDAYQLQLREQNLNTAISAGSIDFFQAEKVRRYKNYDLAMAHLEVEKRNREDQIKQMDAMHQQQLAAAQNQQAQVAQQIEQQKMEVEAKKEQQKFIYDLMLNIVKLGKDFESLPEEVKLIAKPYLDELKTKEDIKKQMAQNIQDNQSQEDAINQEQMMQ